MADLTDVSQMPMSGPQPNEPSSGTYGAKAQVDALKKAIGMPPPNSGGAPGGAPAGPPDMSTAPGGVKPSTPGGPFGLPAAITNPTQQPNVPSTTPLAAPPVNPVAGAQGQSQKNLALLDMLTRNPDVSDSTREWAQLVLNNVVQASKT